MFSRSLDPCKRPIRDQDRPRRDELTDETMTDKQNDSSSTLGAAINYAKGTAQQGYAAVTGDTSQRVKGETNQNIANQQDQASHAAAKVGPVSASSEGVAVDNKDAGRARGTRTLAA